MKIFLNTIKIVMASVAAILLAVALNLEFAVSAGIIAILSVGPSKKETVKTALGRLLAFFCALIISFVCFECIGFNIAAFFVYLFFFILICQYFGWISAMAMDSVLISHFLSVGSMDVNMIINEVLLFVIGVSAGIIVNLSLHKNEKLMDKLIDEMDTQIKKILSRMSEKIVTGDITDYNGDCFRILSKMIARAHNLADENYQNELIGEDTFDIEYVKMREKQYNCLYEMYKNVRVMKTNPVQAEKISHFLKQVATEYDLNNTMEKLIADFDEMDLAMKSEPLPVTREEFEDRALLFSLLRHLGEFLDIKKEFADKHL